MPSNIMPFALPLLHIDDNPEDRFLIEEAIRATSTRFDFRGVDDLETAIAYFGFLPRVTQPAGPTRPALVLLDYDLGVHCGPDFLYWLRSQHQNTTIPVVVYSGSSGEARVRECYAQGANYFLRKAQSFAGTKAIIRALHFCFCLTRPSFQCLARLPESEPDPRLVQPIKVNELECEVYS